MNTFEKMFNNTISRFKRFNSLNLYSLLERIIEVGLEKMNRVNGYVIIYLVSVISFCAAGPLNISTVDRDTVQLCVILKLVYCVKCLTIRR